MKRSAAVLALMTATALAATVTPAHAADITYLGFVDYNGVTKANVTYKRDTNKLCTTTISGGKTRSVADLRIQGVPVAFDTGGDNDPGCIRVPAQFDNQHETILLTWYGTTSGGLTNTSYSLIDIIT